MYPVIGAGEVQKWKYQKKPENTIEKNLWHEDVGLIKSKKPASDMTVRCRNII